MIKFGGYVSDRNYPKEHLKQQAQKELEKAGEVGFDVLLEKHTNEWTHIWERADIQIGGDVKAQQAIRFNIFQLNQTYTSRKFEELAQNASGSTTNPLPHTIDLLVDTTHYVRY